MKNSVHVEVEVRSWLTLRARVVIHPSEKKLKAAYRFHSGLRDDNVEAFCLNEDEDTHLEGRVTEIHFCPFYLNSATVSHEAFHAGLALARRMGVNTESDEGEEFIAEFVGRITNRTYWLARSAGLKVKPVTLDD